MLGSYSAPEVTLPHLHLIVLDFPRDLYAVVITLIEARQPSPAPVSAVGRYSRRRGLPLYPNLFLDSKFQTKQYYYTWTLFLFIATTVSYKVLYD